MDASQNEAADEHPPPGLLDRLLGATLVALALAAAHAWAASWDLGLLGKILVAPLALFGYELAVLPLVWLYAGLKARFETLPYPDPPLVVAVLEPLKLGLFAVFMLGLGLQFALLPPTSGEALLELGGLTLAALIGWGAVGLVLLRLGRRVRTRRQLVGGGALVLGATLALALASGGAARLSGVPAEENALDASARAASVAPPTSLRTTAPSGRRVLVIGIDGGDPDELLPLVEAGQAPAFARLIQGGTLLPLKAENYPLGSPVLWTSMVTGVGHEAHGIDCLLTVRAPGLPLIKITPQAVRPVSNPSLSVLGGYLTVNAIEAGPPPSNTRRAAPVWTTISELGGSVRMVGWPATWPAEAVRGELLTARTRRTSWEVFHPFRPEQPGLSYPPGLFKRLSEAVGDQRAPHWEDLDGLAEWTPEDRRRLGDWSNTILSRDELSFLSLALTGDRWNTRALRHLLAEGGPRDLTLCAFYSVDLSSHMFWDAAHPEEFDPAPSPDRMRYAGILKGVWRLLDRWIGELLAAVDEQTLVIVVSDHGMKKSTFLDFKAHHSEDAFLIAWGPGVPARGVVKDTGARSMDVAPTILERLGWPVPEAFEGRVLSELFEPR